MESLFYSSELTDTSTGGGASLRSYPSFAVRGDLKWYEGERFYSDVGGGYSMIRWSTVDPYTLSPSSQNLTDYYLGFGWIPAKRARWILKGSGGIRESSFHHAVSTTNFSMEKVSIPFGRLAILFVGSNKKSVWFEPFGEFLMSATASAGYTVDSGWAGGARIGKPKGRLDFYLGYRYEQQNSSILQRQVHVVSLGVSLKLF